LHNIKYTTAVVLTIICNKEYNSNMNNKFVTTTEAGIILGLDRTQVFRLVKSGKIPAQKAGRNYIIKLEDIGVSDNELSDNDKTKVERSVEQVFRQYGETIKKLGEE